MFVHTVIMVIEPHMKQGRQHKLISTIFLATSVTKKLDHNIKKVLPGHHQLDIPVSLIADIEAGFAQLERAGKLKQGNGLFKFQDFQIHNRVGGGD